MKTLSLQFSRFWILAAIGFVATAILLCAWTFIPKTPFEKPVTFDLAAWIQAVGSVAAILVAVWVSTDQAAQQRIRDAEREKNAAKGMLQSLVAEVESTVQYMVEGLMPALALRRSDEPFRHTLPIPAQPFPVFDALIPSLGGIDKPELLQQIFRSYAVAKSCAVTISYHNILLAELTGVEIQYREMQTPFTSGRVEDMRQQVIAYSDSLTESLAMAKKALDDLLPAMSNEIATR